MQWSRFRCSEPRDGVEITSRSTDRTRFGGQELLISCEVEFVQPGREEPRSNGGPR